MRERPGTPPYTINSWVQTVHGDMRQGKPKEVARS